MPSLYDMDQSPTYDKVSCIFYDIESLKNAFTAVTYLAKINTFEVFYAVPQSIYDADNAVHEPVAPHAQLEAFIRSTIPELPIYTKQAPTFTFHNLSTIEGSRALIRRFGLSSAQYQVAKYYEHGIADSDYDQPMADGLPAYHHPISDVCSSFDPYNNVDHSYFFGYNSERYDLVVLSFVMNLLSRAPHGFTDSMVGEIRGFNDLLFSRYRNNMTDVFSHYDALENRRKYLPLKRIRESWLATGRYLDLANALTSFAALKRLSAFKGGSVKTHEGLERDPQLYSYDDFLNLIAYNVSDVLKTKVVADDKTFYAPFDQKMLILKDYPELVFDETYEGSYLPDTGNLEKVRFGRFRADSTSARFVAKVLCPWGYLNDIPCVSFNYPNETVAKERGLTTSNVLEDTKNFFYSKTSSGSDADAAARSQFDRIYTYYKNLEGKNFNTSERQVLYRDKLRQQCHEEYEQTVTQLSNTITLLANTANTLDPESDEYQGIMQGMEYESKRLEIAHKQYAQRMNIFDDRRIWTPADFDRSQVDEQGRRISTFLPYFGPCSAPTSAFVTFSLGGIHGGEYYKDLYELDQRLLEQRKALRQALEDDFDASGHTDKTQWAKSFTTFTFKGKTYKRSDLMTVSKKDNQVKFKPLVDNFKPIELVKYNAKGKAELNERYRYTSMAESNHEDFKSYYPMLLMMLAAFVNPRFHTQEDKDRYMKFFEGKEHFGALIKDTSLDEITRELYKLIQAGYKLFLNSASGAGDVPYDTPIRMNNVIISMRAIGQLFTWRVGQAQAFEGALVISSNTDGLYTVFDEALNNAILAEQSKVINVQIDPERQIVISKDSNNRLILKASKDFKVTGDLFADAQHLEIEEHSGAQLAHASGPIISKSPVIPSIAYHALAKYLSLVYLADTYGYKTDISLTKPANVQAMIQIIKSYLATASTRDVLTNFQQIIKSSGTGPSFPYAVHSSAVLEQTTKTSVRSKAKKDYVVDAAAVNQDKSLIQILPDINRIYWVKDEQGFTIQYATFGSRGMSAVTSDVQCYVAKEVVNAKGIVKTNQGHSLWPQGKTLSTSKYSGVSRTQIVAIENGDFYLMEDSASDLIDRLDVDAYAQAAADMFNSSWMNKPLEAYA